MSIYVYTVFLKKEIQNRVTKTQNASSQFFMILHRTVE
jgi:hypothetical protein